MEPIKRGRRPVSEKSDKIITPSETLPPQINQFDSVLEKFNEMQTRLEKIESENQDLKKQVASAKGDISEEIKEAKRRYGYDFTNQRIPEESFKFKYKVLVMDREEKVVISSHTIGRPVNSRNENTGKWVNIHNVEIEFHDGSKTVMDVLDYINQHYTIEQEVPESDIKKIDGVKHYTFRTEKFGDFTIAENFIN